MHLIETLTGEAARTLATTRSPYGPGFSQEEAQTIHTLEVHGSSFNDPGPDAPTHSPKPCDKTSKTCNKP